jgi:hypothetical protein
LIIKKKPLAFEDDRFWLGEGKIDTCRLPKKAIHVTSAFEIMIYVRHPCISPASGKLFGLRTFKYQGSIVRSARKQARIARKKNEKKKSEKKKRGGIEKKNPARLQKHKHTSNTK